MGIRGGVLGHAVGLAADQPNENFALGARELARVLDDCVGRAIVELGKVVRLPIVSRSWCEQRVECFLPSRVGLRPKVFAVCLTEAA